MPDGGDSTTLYGVRATWKVAGAETEAVIGAAEAVTEATGAGAMTVGEDAPLAVTAVLTRHVLELPP